MVAVLYPTMRYMKTNNLKVYAAGAKRPTRHHSVSSGRLRLSVEERKAKGQQFSSDLEEMVCINKTWNHEQCVLYITNEYRKTEETRHVAHAMFRTLQTCREGAIDLPRWYSHRPTVAAMPTTTWMKTSRPTRKRGLVGRHC
jgi:hypothetical protein